MVHSGRALTYEQLLDKPGAEHASLFCGSDSDEEEISFINPDASSTPFIFAQLWVAWGSPGEAICKFNLQLFCAPVECSTKLRRYSVSGETIWSFQDETRQIVTEYRRF